jgi:hypothetical protein
MKILRFWVFAISLTLSLSVYAGSYAPEALEVVDNGNGTGFARPPFLGYT